MFCITLRDAADVLKNKIAHVGPRLRACYAKPLSLHQSSCCLPPDLAILPRLNPFEYSISFPDRTCIFVPMLHSLANHCSTKKLCDPSFPLVERFRMGLIWGSGATAGHPAMMPFSPVFWISGGPVPGHLCVLNNLLVLHSNAQQCKMFRSYCPCTATGGM